MHATLAAIDYTHLTRPENFGLLLRVAFLLLVIWPLLLLLARLIHRLVRPHVSAQSAMLVRHGITYLGTILIALTVMRELGFKMSAVLGAAGIAGVAIGFASQTSLSNLISGIFLIWEKPFQLGDLIKAGDSIGFVHAIDLLSVKLRTFDNQFVRIPNETLLKEQTTNVTYFPIRRMDITIGVAYKEDLERVLELLKDLANKNPYCLDEPTPLVVVKDFADSSINFTLGMWFLKTDYLLLRNSFLPALKKRFDEEGIEIPFPHRTLYTGSESTPFPIRIVDERELHPTTPAPPSSESCAESESENVPRRTIQPKIDTGSQGDSRKIHTESKT